MHASAISTCGSNDAMSWVGGAVRSWPGDKARQWSPPARPPGRRFGERSKPPGSTSLTAEVAPSRLRSARDADLFLNQQVGTRVLLAGDLAGGLRPADPTRANPAARGVAVWAVASNPLAPRTPRAVTGLNRLPNRPQDHERQPDERDREENHSRRVAPILGGR